SAYGNGCTIELFNAYGTRVAGFDQQGDDYVRVPLQGLAAGMYVLRAHTAHGSVSSTFVKID
ncbi:MAG: T9SS type A sorting domain-containing protein, partial [Candidatus Kapaibacterium sp.]